MNIIWIILLFVVGVFLALAVGGGLLVLLAYGVGWLLNLVMHFEPFQVTVLALAGMLVFGILAERLWQMISNPPPFTSSDDEDEDEDDYYDEYDEGDEYDDEPPVISNPGIPRWRQPLKNPDFSNVKPDDRCPCGSGRKYKNCHGSKRPK